MKAQESENDLRVIREQRRMLMEEAVRKSAHAVDIEAVKARSLAQAELLRASEIGRTMAQNSQVMKLQKDCQARTERLQQEAEKFLGQSKRYEEQTKRQSKAYLKNIEAAKQGVWGRDTDDKIELHRAMNYAILQPKESPEKIWQSKQIVLFEALGEKLDAMALHLKENASFSRQTREIQAEHLKDSRLARQEASDTSKKVIAIGLFTLIATVVTMIITLISAMW